VVALYGHQICRATESLLVDTEYQRKHLLPTLIAVEWPLKPPFTENPFELLDKLAAKGKSK
jgi:hypothetical protein